MFQYLNPNLGWCFATNKARLISIFSIFVEQH